MKQKLKEFYSYSSAEIEGILKDGFIVLDTNVLLNLYRCTNSTRNEFIKILKGYSKQLWLPYQVAYEYHRNRKKVICDAMVSFGQLNGIVEKAFKNLSSTLQVESMPLSVNKVAIRQTIDKFKRKIENEITKAQNSYPDFSKKDTVLDSITDLFDGFVGDDYTADELSLIFKEGKKRYADKIPPGYCDLKEKGKNNDNQVIDERRLYGDLIIWKSIINKAKTEKKDIIFITDDKKEDWWEKIGGKHSPRVELIREFVNETDQRIKFYSFKGFLNSVGIDKTAEGKKAMKEIDSLCEMYYHFITENMLENIGSINLDDIKISNVSGEYPYSSNAINPLPSEDSIDNTQDNATCS